MMPIGFATENHETLLDVDHIIHHLQHRNDKVTFIRMPCVNDRSEFLKMVADWANPQIEALLAQEGVAVNPQLAVAQAMHHHHHHHH
jgi:ferrochelatase